MALKQTISHQLLQQLVDQVQGLLGQGRVADYIPALATVDPNQIGIALCDTHGQLFSAGDAQTPFSIQSISKLFTLVQVLQIYQDEIWKRVDREPSGQRFNSLVQLEFEQGVPRNPFINAGAIVICDLLQSRCAAPNFQLLELLRNLSGNPAVRVNQQVARSELQHGARNAAMAYLMKSFGNFENAVDTVLESYSHHCAIEMSCQDLAKASLFLANQGQTVDGQQLLSATQTRRVNALLATCGLYDAAGDFAYRVGLPAKSGVGGGIVAVLPGQFSVCVWSPELNEFGNSLIGTQLLELLTQTLGVSVY